MSLVEADVPTHAQTDDETEQVSHDDYHADDDFV